MLFQRIDFWLALTISCHAGLSWHAGWNENDFGALQSIGELLQNVACDRALCVYMANVGRDTCESLSICAALFVCEQC